MKVYAFDVDETLAISGGPIQTADALALRDQGHLVGLCGNWAAISLKHPEMMRSFHFFGPMVMPKEMFLGQIRSYLPAEEYVMVGNIPGVSGASNDQAAAELARWRFIQEAEFARGTR